MPSLSNPVCYFCQTSQHNYLTSWQNNLHDKSTWQVNMIYHYLTSQHNNYDDICHIIMSTCQIILSTYQIIMLTKVSDSQIIMLTCQIIMLTSQTVMLTCQMLCWLVRKICYKLGGINWVWTHFHDEFLNKWQVN
jgi:hypothetical protein